MGTGSNVGKHTITTLLLGFLRKIGAYIQPFKGLCLDQHCCILQNNKSMSIPQCIQSYAAEVEPDPQFSPIVILPSGEKYCVDVIEFGERYTIEKELLYSEKENKFNTIVRDSLLKIKRKSLTVLAEGAGCAWEFGLTHYDKSNWMVAEQLDASVLIVTDMDQGGGYTSVLGTILSIPKSKRNRIKGIILNKIRIDGDVTTLLNGIAELETRTLIPVVGILPYFNYLPFNSENTTKDLYQIQCKPNDDFSTWVSETVSIFINEKALLAEEKEDNYGFFKTKLLSLWN